tara:strand:+ start:70 stop:477 length:408 start_codon:yes stop_codon:yes gene_type:complete
MREIIKILKYQIGEFVICGSLALYLHGLLDDYNHEEIDIIVDLPDKKLLAIQPDVIINPVNAMLMKGAGYRINGVYIDVFNRPLPEYDTVIVDGLIVKIKTLSALKEHYLSLDMNTIGGHEKFKNKLLTRINLFK